VLGLCTFAGPSGVQVQLELLFSEQPTPEHQHALADDLTDFQNRGWIVLMAVLGFEGWACYLTPDSIGYIERIYQLRGDLIGARRR
jgi:hypothetical protein